MQPPLPAPSAPPEESSLDRYLEKRAGLILSHASARRGLMIVGAMGAVMLAMALIVVVSALVSLNPAAMGGAVGPAIGGLVNVFLWRRFRSRFKPALEFDTDLTPDARAFMAELMQDVYGWPEAWGSVEAQSPWHGEGPYQSPRRRRRERRAWGRMYATGSWGKRQKSANQCLSPAAFQVLDRAAAEYNRVMGILETGHPDLARYASSVKGASDQAMADVFHAAQIIENYPESGQTPLDQAELEIKALRDLGDELSSIQSRPSKVVGPEDVRPSPVTAILEELRLDQLARAELSGQVENPELEQKLDA